MPAQRIPFELRLVDHIASERPPLTRHTVTDPQELLARVRAHLRTFEQSEDAIFRLGPYEFRPAQKLLIDEKDRKIRLTEKETNILKYLYRAGGKPGRTGAGVAAPVAAVRP